MKRSFCVILCIAIIFSLALPCSAVGTERVSQTIDLGNGLTATDTIRVSALARGTRIAEKTRTVKDGTTVIAEITIEGVFSYDGYTSDVLSKSVTRADTYDGWRYTQNSFIENGGTITLSGKITKQIYSHSFTLSLSCDAQGNIS